jgi:hypothetical protein
MPSLNQNDPVLTKFDEIERNLKILAGLLLCMLAGGVAAFYGGWSCLAAVVAGELGMHLLTRVGQESQVSQDKPKFLHLRK